MALFQTAKLTLALIGASFAVAVGVEKAAESSFKFTNETKAREGGQVLASAIARDRSLVFNAAEITLIKVHNAASKPMERNAGKTGQEPGAFSRAPLVGKAQGILMFGPYAPLEAGRHLVVYRFLFPQEPRTKESVCILDVCSEMATFSDRRPTVEEVIAESWQEIAVPVDVPKKMNFEFRFWSHNQEVVIDRVYVYRLVERSPATAPISIMGDVKRTGSFVVPKDGTSAKVALELAGGKKAKASKELIGGVWRPGDGVYTRIFQGKETTDMRLMPGDVLWVSEGANAKEK